MKSAVASGLAARRMQPLLERGRSAWLHLQDPDHRSTYSTTDMAIVTIDDAIAQPRLLFEYVSRVKSVHVLDHDGELSTIVCPQRAA